MCVSWVSGVQSVGRLDVDTTGLLLLTDDGKFAHTITSPKHLKSKVYHVTCKHPLEDRYPACNAFVAMRSWCISSALHPCIQWGGGGMQDLGFGSLLPRTVGVQ